MLVEGVASAELEDLESNLERLRKYLAQVEARDVFEASGRAHAAAEIERCAEAFEAFTQDVYAHQVEDKHVDTM